MSIELLLSIILLVLSGQSLFLTFYVSALVKNSKQIADQLPVLLGEEYEIYSDEEIYETASEEELQVQERVEAREKAFDERIARIKEELDKEQVADRRGTDAEILHAGVYNLPHENIPEPNPPTEEYSL